MSKGTVTFDKEMNAFLNGKETKFSVVFVDGKFFIKSGDEVKPTSYTAARAKQIISVWLRN